MSKALGMVEVVGYACAVNVADIMTKTADVIIKGVQRARGSGWLTIKVTGDVGAVQASVTAGKAQAQQDHLFVTSKVIPRLATDVAPVFLPHASKPLDKKKSTVPTKADKTIEKPAPEQTDDKQVTVEKPKKPTYTCNLCHDPACPRKKGEPRASCIHFKELDAGNSDESTQK
uniref:Propanediol utilization polyhedral body protein PduK n=1 Tax=Loigolactobacillus rennini TaxID=238013 RepID=A0A1K2I879_9LACO|nr:Propanediol utilization polyhedral body protein PduK [Loigolactobacillus rennini]